MLRAIAIVCCLLGASHPGQAAVDIALTKTQADQWLLTYTLDQPAHRLVFKRNPDQSRQQRWLPRTAGFEIQADGGQEYLARADQQAFSTVTVALTPTYTHLPKDYAPFSPYSDGGMLVHSGRWFACAEVCTEADNQWSVSVQAPAGDHILVNGQQVAGEASWLDSNAGTKVYIGKQHAVETDHVLAVIDPGLPAAMQTALAEHIPTLMAHFAHQLGGNSGIKPMLFASYANVAGHSTQGGTLDNQIFMHWNVNNLDEQVKDESFTAQTMWFFAHEVAHFFQQDAHHSLYGSSHEAWIHEGHAEWLAARALPRLFPHTQAFVDNKLLAHQQQCQDGLAALPLDEAAANGRFDLYYSCGLVIYQMLATAQHTPSAQALWFALWRDYRTQVQQGAAPGAATLLALAEAYTHSAVIDTIQAMLAGPQAQRAEPDGSSTPVTAQ